MKTGRQTPRPRPLQNRTTPRWLQRWYSAISGWKSKTEFSAKHSALV